MIFSPTPKINIYSLNFMVLTYRGFGTLSYSNTLLIIIQHWHSPIITMAYSCLFNKSIYILYCSCKPTLDVKKYFLNNIIQIIYQLYSYILLIQLKICLK